MKNVKIYNQLNILYIEQIRISRDLVDLELEYQNCIITPTAYKFIKNELDTKFNTCSSQMLSLKKQIK